MAHSRASQKYDVKTSRDSLNFYFCQPQMILKGVDVTSRDIVRKHAADTDANETPTHDMLMPKVTR